MRAFCRIAVIFPVAGLAVAHGQLALQWERNPETDVAGYVLYLGTASGTYTTLVDAGDATSHTFSGLETGTVYFCRLQAYNTDGQVSAATAEMTFTLESGAQGFGEWAAAGGLNGASALPKATPHHDGVPNLLKFAFNLNPAASDVRTLVKGSGTAGLPAITLGQSGGQTKFTVEYLRRRDSGLLYTVKTSGDLVVYATIAGATTTVTPINSGWERVVVEKNVTGSERGLFGRVEVAMP